MAGSTAPLELLSGTPAARLLPRMLPMNFFRLPTHVSIEPGCLAQLPELVQQLGSQRVLLVTDEYLSQTEFCRTARAGIEGVGASCEVVSKVESNPRTTTVERIAELARERDSQVMIGIGGGSVLDAAKAAAMLATNGGALLDYVGKDRIAKQPLPFIAVPTTCGTGSEVTWVSVVTSEDAASKVSVKGLGMFPDYALVDAELIAQLPRPLLASTSMDALTHAIEASTGAYANPVSDALSDRAVQRIFGYLERAVADSAGDLEARDHIACASTLAGVSFGNSDVGAVHCLSETLGGLFDVPHGLANAILLGPVLRYQLASSTAPLSRFEGVVAGRPRSTDGAAASEAAASFVERVEALSGAVEIPLFSSLDIPRDAYGDIAARCVANGSNNSCPQTMAESDYRHILEHLG